MISNPLVVTILTPLLLSFALTALATPFVIWLAKKYGMVDDPNKRPHPAHVQARIVPRAGGLAIYLGVIFSTLLLIPLEKYLFGIFGGISVLLLMGLADDKMVKFSPYTRLLLLVLAALLAVGAGIGITFITNPLANLHQILPPVFSGDVIRLDSFVIPFNFLGDHKIIVIADTFALLWIISLTQIINWSKGVDGQMPGITLIASITLGLLALKFYFAGDPNQLNIAKLAFIVAGTSGGFLIFNWYPAKIWPGFSGSTILAFMLAILAILSTAKMATALLVLAIPAVDFVYTFFRRILSGHSPVWGDRGHLHHRLLDLGWSHQKISLFYMLGSVILGAVSLFVDTGSKVFAVAVVGVVFMVFILWLNSFYQRD